MEAGATPLAVDLEDLSSSRCLHLYELCPADAGSHLAKKGSTAFRLGQSNRWRVAPSGMALETRHCSYPCHLLDEAASYHQQ